MLISFNAFADIRSYECVNQRSSKFTFSVNDHDGQPADRWEADGDDGTNPMICDPYRFTASDKIVFDCQSYQGVRYGFLTVPKALPPTLTMNFIYIDQMDGSTSGRYDGECKLIVQ